jgi:hypothetical protein
LPVCKRPVEMIELSARNAKVVPEVDVLVVGGGPAGIGAAMGAAEAGAQVVLAEHYGFLGGNATVGLVLTWASYHTAPIALERKKGSFHIFPTDHAAGKPVIAGVLAKLVKRLVDNNGALAPSVETGFLVPFDPESFKLVSLQMLDVAGVEFLFHAFASGVISYNSYLKGVVFETKSGPVVVKAKIIVDCTGDGDVAALADVPFEVGREEDGLVQPVTLMFLMDNFSKTDFERYVKMHPDEWNGVQGLRTLMQEAASKGELDIPREDILLFETIHENKVSVNSTRITNVLGIDVWDLVHAEIESRRQIRQLTAFLSKYVPGFEKAYLLQSGTSVCVRETRRINCEYMLTGEDVLGARKFKDVIAHGVYPIDIHNPKGKGTLLKRVRAGDAYDIPLRCLIPLKVENLLVGGRCISGTHEASASYRVMPISMATGHAAGVCAAIASKNNTTPRRISAKKVQTELIRQGAYLETDQTDN